MSRRRYGEPLAISTVGTDQSWEEIRRFLGGHLPAAAFELEQPPGRA